jgi:hypothetical protein
LRFGSGRFEDPVEKAGQIYASIAREIERLSNPGCLALEIVLDGVDWLVDVLNGTKMADKNVEDFRALLFQLLRYQTVSAARGKWL